MSITLDVSSVPANPAGAGRYIVELAKGLAGTDVEVTAIARRDDEERWSTILGADRVQAVVPRQRPLRLLWEQLQMPSELAALGPSLHHGPHYTLPERARVRKIATLHDMTFFDHPEWHERLKVPVFRRAIARAASRADALIAVSEDTARRVRERFGDVTITAIPLGVDHGHFRPSRDALDDTHDRSLLRSCGIEGDFVAFVGTIEPRKNVPALLRAFDRLDRSDLQLVIAGRRGWGGDAFDAVLAEMRHPERVLQTGFLPDDAVPAMLRQARVVAYPSLQEGFGLPALEALACGAPLVTTSGSAMEEVVDDAAVLIAPDDEDALTGAIEDLLANGERWRPLGPAVAARYTWDACVAAHVALYRSFA